MKLSITVPKFYVPRKSLGFKEPKFSAWTPYTEIGV